MRGEARERGNQGAGARAAERASGWGPDAWSAVRRWRVHMLRGVNRRALEGMARAASLHPLARPGRHGVERIRDVAYLPSGLEAHRLDVWRPKGVGSAPGQRSGLPAVLHVHGGGFSILSKDTHWVMGLALARRGFVVFNVNYRLVREGPFPAGLEDVVAAYRFVQAEGARYGADPTCVAVMGESAGANLVTALTVAACTERPEPWARGLLDAGPAPRATLPICGILDVEDAGRFRRRKARLPALIADTIEVVAHRYVAGSPAANRELASPLKLLERDDLALARALPPFFTACGTRDPILDDTRRLDAALRRRGVACEALYAPGEPHAYHAFVFRKAAQAFWRHAEEFLRVHIGDGAARAPGAVEAPAGEVGSGGGLADGRAGPYQEGREAGERARALLEQGGRARRQQATESLG